MPSPTPSKSKYARSAPKRTAQRKNRSVNKPKRKLPTRPSRQKRNPTQSHIPIQSDNPVQSRNPIQNPKSKIQNHQNRYVMVGGFLGSGKTTALSQLAKHLTALKQRVGLITNDQGTGLVDTALLTSRGFAVEEIPGGCFCCRFNSLVEAAARLTSRSRPDVFLAEPVGSCTDLVATV